MIAGMRVAITGASGFIGGAIARALAADGCDVLAFGRRPAEELSAPLAGYRRWDLADGPTDLRSVDALVHCAAAVGQWGPASVYERDNVRGTEHALVSVGRQARIVHLSSASVYAHVGGGPIAEDAPLASRGGNAYVRTKVAAERLVLARGATAVVLRPHIVYGPGDTTLWPRVRAAVRGGVLRVPGDGTARVSCTHIEHLVQAVRRALEPGAAHGCFNIADAEPVTVRQLLETVFARQGLSVRLRFVPRPIAWSAAKAVEGLWHALRRLDEPPITRYAVRSLATDCVLDITRATRALGYVPRWRVADGPL